MEFSVIGSQPPPRNMIVPFRYGKEDGSDGVVRVAASNLNHHYLRIGPSRAPQDVKWDEAVTFSKRAVEASAAGDTADFSNADAVFAGNYYTLLEENIPDEPPIRNAKPAGAPRPAVPFAIPYCCAHSTEEMGIVSGTTTRKEVLELIKEALNCPDHTAQAAVAAKFGELTGSTYDKVRQGDHIDHLSGLFDGAKRLVEHFIHSPQAQYDRHAQVSVRVRDQHGNPINDCSIHFNSFGGGAKPRLVINKLFEDTHQNKTSPDTTTFYLRLEAWDRTDWVDRLAQVNGVDFEIDCIDPKTQRIVFVPLRMRLNTDLLARYLKPHRATLIDVELLRLPARDTFSMFSYSPSDDETAQAKKEEEDDLPKRAGGEVFVRVHYATNRAMSGMTDPNHYYGSERGDLRYGQAIVSIPADHTMGEMERPTIWRIEFKEDRKSHVVLRDIRELDHTQFFDELHSEIEHTKESASFVFIHGFNVTFAAAARRAAQMAYDLFLIGQQRSLATLSTVPILYSWPSKGGLLGAGDYFHDAADSEASGGLHLKAFLHEVATRSGAASITIVAHSMGSRALTTALNHIGLGMPPGAKPLVKEIILAAPDIDRDVFLNVANAVTRTCQRVTLYASNRDRALKASKAANGFPRLGDATGGITVFPGAESIDASVVGEEILAHSYYGETSVLSDLYYLISQGTSPDHRFGFIAQGTPPNNYWIMRARNK